MHLHISRKESDDWPKMPNDNDDGDDGDDDDGHDNDDNNNNYDNDDNNNNDDGDDDNDGDNFFPLIWLDLSLFPTSSRKYVCFFPGLLSNLASKCQKAEKQGRREVT